MARMLLRATVEADLGRVLACATTDPISRVTADSYLSRLADRHYRPEWTWIAEEGGQFLARAVWWGFPHSSHPLALDCLYVRESVADRVGLAAALLTQGHRALLVGGAPALPAYHIFLPNGWRGEPQVLAEASWRRQAAARAGLTDELERLQYEWLPGAGVPPASGRLTFSPEPDDQVFLAAFRRVAEGSLDVQTRREVAAVGADRQAREDMDIYLGLGGHRDWWRLAHAPDGGLAGLAIPSRNTEGPVVGYLGVVPELRGHGYVDDLLAEITRFHAVAGAQCIRADTDTTNLPMAAAFDRAGYRVFAIRLVLSAPHG